MRPTFVLCIMLGLAQGIAAPAPDRAAGEKTLHDAFGRPFVVTDVVDLSDALSPDEFWAKIHPSRKLGAAVDPWHNALTRDYFFGRYEVTGTANAVQRADELLALPHASGMLGKPVDPARPRIIADDIPFHPILRQHVQYSLKYYPRRMADWVTLSFLPAYLQTGRAVYRERFCELLDYLLFSQYQADGSNRFTQQFYPEDFARLQASGQTRQWRGGWDYLFDWEWQDAYGYRWQLHEPDHHVCSAIAMTMIQGWQHTGRRDYFAAAEEFFHHQMPQYGFHTGIWNGHRYYWTQYDRCGQPGSATSATDNIMALVARTAAMLGYYKQDPVLLEYARGLLWYEVREFATDGRWYYDGAENPKNSRRAESHDMVVVEDSLVTLAYLLKAGMPVDEMIAPLGQALAWHRENLPALKNERDFQAWQLMDGAGAVVYVKVNAEMLAKLELPEAVRSSATIARLEPTDTGWTESVAKPDARWQRGDILQIKISGRVTAPLSISAGVKARGHIAKNARVIPAGSLVDSDTFPGFPARVYFPNQVTLR